LLHRDKDSKQRLKLFPAQSNSLLAAEFNASGSLFAYAIGYDFSRGSEQAEAKKTPNHIAIQRVQEADIARR